MAAEKKDMATLQAKLKDLVAKSSGEQLEHFLKTFIFELGDNWKDVIQLEKEFRKRVSEAQEGKPDLNPIMAADFLQKSGLERTAIQRKQEVADIDLDKNGRISFIEYLLLHYKKMILEAYYKRTGVANPHDLSRGGVGVTGVGQELLDQLFTPSVILDPAVARAIEEFTAQQRQKEDKVKELSAKAAAGGVKGKAAANELAQLESEDKTKTNRIEITLNATKKKAMRDSGEEALKKKQHAKDQEEKAKREQGRANLAAKAALWNSKQ